MFACTGGGGRGVIILQVNIHQVNIHQNKVCVAISDQTNIKEKIIPRDKEVCDHQEDTIIRSKYAACQRPSTKDH